MQRYLQQVGVRRRSICSAPTARARRSGRTSGGSRAASTSGRIRSRRDAARLNEASRELYRQEVQGLIDRLNTYVGEDQQKLMIPSVKFNRRIGEYKKMHFDVHGEPIEASKYEAYVASVLPTSEDRELLRNIFKENDWIQPKKSDD